MKSTFRLIPILILSFVFNSTIMFAQNSNESAVKAVLNNLLEYSKAKSFEKAATLIAYDGTDKKRIGKDSFNPSNKDEINQVKRICKKISALIELSTQHEFGVFSIKKENENEFYNMEVIFISGDQKLVTSFSFIKTDNKYLLFNMN